MVYRPFNYKVYIIAINCHKQNRFLVYFWNMYGLYGSYPEKVTISAHSSRSRCNI